MSAKTSTWFPKRWNPFLRLLVLPILITSLAGCQSLSQDQRQMKVEEENGYSDTFLRMDPRLQTLYESQLSEIDLYRSQECKPFLKKGSSGGSPSTFPGKTVEETKAFFNAIWFKDYPATLKVRFGQRDGAYVIQIGAHQGVIELLDELLYEYWYANKNSSEDKYFSFPFSNVAGTIGKMSGVLNQLEDNAKSLCALPYSVNQDQETEYETAFMISRDLYQQYASLAADYGEYFYNWKWSVE